jgi:mannosyltransferase OCH1-like enzyme
MIPKKIYQTHKSFDIDTNTENLIKSIIKCNREFDYTFMDNNMCYEFISNNFDKEFVDMYTALPLDIMRADVWRVAVIYINGGVYCDTDVLCKNDLSELIHNEEFIIFNEELGGISNFFFAAYPKHPALKAVLDSMLKNYKRAFDLNQPLLVQNFGMALFHEAIQNYNGKIKHLSYDESLQWVKHLFYGSWRDSENEYRHLSYSNKPITFITTFNENGYELYGKTWIDSFIKNVANKRNNIKAIVYAHNLPNLIIDHPQVQILDYDTIIPEHKEWKEQFLKNSNHTHHIQNYTIRFSHKGFVMQHALDTIKEGYLIWLDGDVVMHNCDYTHFPDDILSDGNVMACQIEDGAHVESGVILFDIENPNIEIFKQKFKDNYTVEAMNEYGEPYDGHVIRRSVIHSEIKYYDLNAEYGVGGIQSDPNCTFLHPEIKKRYTHNIGITGKHQYENWEQLKYKDKFFSMLARVPILSETEIKLRKLKEKRLKFKPGIQ